MFYGNIFWFEDKEGAFYMRRDEEISYSQYLFILDILDAYKEAYRISNELERRWLNRRYGESIKQLEKDIIEANKVGFAERGANANEIVYGATHTEEKWAEIHNRGKENQLKSNDSNSNSENKGADR